VVSNKEVEVGARAYDLLIALAERSERVVGKAELMDLVWPNLVVEENNLQVQVHALRRLLGSQAISTIPGRGYRLTAARMPDAVPMPTAQDAGPQYTLAPSPDFNQTPDARQARFGNLPAHLAPLYGREANVESVASLLLTQRLVTITGTGGLGKSRLALHTAWTAQDHFAHGVWLIEVALVKDLRGLIEHIAQTLGLGLPGRREPIDELIDALQPQSMLLLLDGCEQVVPEVAQLVQRLLNRTAQIRVLATSQERLRLAEERVYALEALSVPEPVDWHHAMTHGAVRLFVERVMAQNRRFAINRENLQGAVAICRQLDGNALAIELAAARVPLIGVRGVLLRLSERLQLLDGSSRHSTSRHLTLLSALEWSHRLLTEPEARMFRRLGIFKDGFCLEACQFYLLEQDDDEWELVNILSSLVEKSLVMVEGDERPRYRLLETSRTFALHKLQQAGETQAWTRRHAQAMHDAVAMFVKARADQLLWAEMNNVRVAFDWAASQEDDVSHQLALALATSTAMPLAVAGLVNEALDRLLRVQTWVNDTTPAPLAARYWQWLGRAGIQGRLPTSRCVSSFNRAEKLFQALGEWRHVHACRRMRAEALMAHHELASAQQALNEAAQLEAPGWPLADRLRRLRVKALLESEQGDDERATSTAELALSLATAAELERYIWILQADIATMQLKAGNCERAVALYRLLATQPHSRHFQNLTVARACGGLMAALIELSQLDEAAQVGLDSIDLMRRSSIFMAHCHVFAWWLACTGQPLLAARFIGAADAFHVEGELRRNAVAQRARDAATAVLSLQGIPTIPQLWLDEGTNAREEDLARLLKSKLNHARLAGRVMPDRPQGND